MFCITVLTLDESLLRFKAASYEHKGEHIVFTDSKTGLLKSFPARNCTIDEVRE